MITDSQLNYITSIYSEALGLPLRFRYAFTTSKLKPTSNEIWIIGGLIQKTKTLLLDTHYNVQFNVPAFDSASFLQSREILNRYDSVLFFSDSTPAAVQLHNAPNAFLFFFDLAQVSFEVLSLIDEPIDLDKHGRCLARFHTQLARWKHPVVDYLLETLTQRVTAAKTRTLTHGILLTHDLDRVHLEPLAFVKALARFDFSGVTRDICETLREVIAFEKDNHITSLNFVLSGSYSLSRYGNRYGSTWGSFRNALTHVGDYPIGLHTSYYSAHDSSRMRKEKNALSYDLGRPVRANRNHYLRFSPHSSWSVYEDSAITIDSSVGFSDENGFRAGFCHLYRPWNLQRDRAAVVWEMPLLYMDGVKNKPEEVWDDIWRVLETLKRFHGCGAVLFHPCELARSEKSKALFIDFVHLAQSQSIPFLDPDSLLASLENNSLDYLY